MLRHVSRRVLMQHQLQTRWKARAIVIAQSTVNTTKRLSSSHKSNGDTSTTGKRRVTKQISDKQFVEDIKTSLIFCGVVGLITFFAVYDKGEDEDTKCLYLQRHTETPRPDWKEKCDAIGFPFSDYPGVPHRYWPGITEPYWNESASYHVHPYGRWQLERAAFELHSMCLEAADEVIHSDKLLEKFEIPRDLWEAVRHSWKTRQADVAGRMDLLWDGTGPPKLAEYNADTPTVLIESAVAQEEWFRDVYGRPGEEGKKNGEEDCYSQFNAISSALEEAFRRMRDRHQGCHLVFTTNKPSPVSEFLEERATVEFVMERARKAGIPTKFIDIEDFDDPTTFDTILKAASGRQGSDPLCLVWKLYPYEWLVQEKLGSLITSSDFFRGNLRWLEPPWKLVLSSKAMLAYLWEKHPNHPNLLPTYWDLATLTKGTNWVAKPRFGREGMGIMYSQDYESWSDFVRTVKQATSSLQIPQNYSNWPIPTTLSDVYQSTSSFVGSSSLAEVLSKYLGQYIGAFDKHAVETSQLREREWGTKHSKEESPTLGYFVGSPIFQQYYPTAKLQGRTIVPSAWIVNGLPAGICFREDVAKTTNDDSCFVPHVVTREGSSAPSSRMRFEYPLSPRARRLREELYGKSSVGSKLNAPSTYEDYRTSHGQGPVGHSSTGGGGISRTSGGGFTDMFRNFYARTRTSAPSKKSSKSPGYAGSQAAKSSHQKWEATKNKNGGRRPSRGKHGTGATAKGASYRGRSGRS